MIGAAPFSSLLHLGGGINNERRCPQFIHQRGATVLAGSLFAISVIPATRRLRLNEKKGERRERGEEDSCALPSRDIVTHASAAAAAITERRGSYVRGQEEEWGGRRPA